MGKSFFVPFICIIFTKSNKKTYIMSYMIHILGEPVEIVENRTEAVWALGSKYGAEILIEAKKSKSIVFTDTFVKVNPILLEKDVVRVREVRINSGYRL